MLSQIGEHELSIYKLLIDGQQFEQTKESGFWAELAQDGLKEYTQISIMKLLNNNY